MTYKISDFRKNMKEKGLQYAFAQDAKATRERHPTIYGIHEACTGPGQIFGRSAQRAQDPTEKAAFTLCKVAGYAIGYPVVLPVAIYSATVRDRIIHDGSTFPERLENAKAVINSRN